MASSRKVASDKKSRRSGQSHDYPNTTKIFFTPPFQTTRSNECPRRNQRVPGIPIFLPLEPPLSPSHQAHERESSRPHPAPHLLVRERQGGEERTHIFVLPHRISTTLVSHARAVGTESPNGLKVGQKSQAQTLLIVPSGFEGKGGQG